MSNRKTNGRNRNAFDRFGLFGNFSTTVKAGLIDRGSTRYSILTAGIHKIGCVILNVNIGPTSRIGLTLAGRVFGYTEFACKSRPISNAELTGLISETGIAGRERVFSITRFRGKVAHTWTKRFIPRVR
jgi:hypothetical protein